MERTKDTIKFNPILFIDMLIKAQRSEEISTKSYSYLVLDGVKGFRKILPIFINHLKVICIYTHIHQCVLLILSNKSNYYLLTSVSWI